MGIYMKSADDIDEVDIIIVGSGTAGCVIAARLAEADPKLSILVIEGGRDNYNDPLVLEIYYGARDKAVHGYEGPVHVINRGYRGKESEADFITAAKNLGMREIQDLQDLDSNDGISSGLRTVSEEGKRQDATHMYLYPKLKDSNKYPNLHVIIEAQVVRVLFNDNKKAVGVEYRANPAFQATVALTAAPTRTVRARKMVVVSYGAYGTPSVLERSGVGDAGVLERAGVPLVVDVPGVGHDYQDHHLFLYPYRTGCRPDETIDAMLGGRTDDFATMLEKKDKTLGWNSINFKAWDRDFKNAPSRPLILMATIMCFLGDPSTVPVGQYVTVGTYTAYPYSRGHLYITGPKVDDPIDFDREFMRRTKMYRGELAAGHPKFPAGSKAACVETEEAPVADVKNIEYAAEDDAAIEQHLRKNVNTTWHSLGTCKMAPWENNSVVDQYLGVYGVEGLKLADLSIVPENVGANTNNTALIISEKAAAILIRELGLVSTAA
ncbi:GMC oxidoreductase-domain-containing protein [Apiospora phragmitis]|uniref:GMC oxidoreductase-domain-containing protein n=1 Tax=Apiospora phragmitis TaxID=2905665 RepID=A0ABR1VQ96_9PEZI